MARIRTDFPILGENSLYDSQSTIFGKALQSIKSALLDFPLDFPLLDFPCDFPCPPPVFSSTDRIVIDPEGRASEPLGGGHDRRLRRPGSVSRNQTG
jgi:hypothetical protein